MFEFFKKLLMSRQLVFEKGQIKVVGETSIMIQGPALVELTDILTKTRGKEGILDIYMSSKLGGKRLAKAIKEKFNMRNVELANLLKDLASLGGWGNFEFIKLDFEEKALICKVEHSPFAELTSQKNKKVCHMIRGLLAGGTSIGFDQEVDCIEAKCLADGSGFCEFIVKPKEKLEKKLVKQQLK